MNFTETQDIVSLSSTIVSTNVFSTDSEDNYRIFRDQSRFWVQRVLVPAITLIGVFGNSITIVIMTRKRMRSSTNTYLASLATFDMVYLIFTFILSLSHYPNIKKIDYYLYWLLWPLNVMICDASSNLSVWLTVTFTIERYFVVCYPIKGKVVCTPTRARKIIIVITVICFLITVPTVFEWKLTEIVDPIDNQTYIQLVPSQLGLNSTYKSVYYYLTVILFVFLPLIILSVLNVLLIRSVRVSGVKRRTLTQNPLIRDSTKNSIKSKNSQRESHRQESRITIMLIGVVILFLICQTPTACVLIYTAINDQYSEDPSKQSLIRGLGNIFNFMVALNAGANFVLYSLLSRKYRQTFIKIFFPKLQKKVLINYSTSSQVVSKTTDSNHI